MSLNFPLYFSVVALCFSIFALRGYQDLLWRITELEDKEVRRRRKEKSERKDESETETV